MNRASYTGLYYLAMPLVFIRLIWRSRRIPEYRRRWRERLGLYTGLPAFERKARCIVFHTVSVGEVHAAAPLILTLLRERPDCSVVVTTSTPTGSSRVKAMLPREVFHVYLPLDLPGAVRRFLGRFRPDLLVVMETELWPNLIHHCHRRGIKILLANARLSGKSARGYGRLGGLAASMLRQLDGVAAQSREDADRLLELGLPEECLQVTGSMKYDLDIPGTRVCAGRELKRAVAGRRPVLIAASTREGEDERVLRAFTLLLKDRPDVLLVLVPRHPERFERAYRQCRAMGLKVVRRSAFKESMKGSGKEKEGGEEGGKEQDAEEAVQVLLGDSMGEMMLYYSAADIAFVGGSLVNTGCQNILEPAALGLPVITGPSLYNFKAVSDRLLRAGGMRVVESEEALARTVAELLDDRALYRGMAAAAARVVQENSGATRKILGMITGILENTDEKRDQGSSMLDSSSTSHSFRS